MLGKVVHGEVYFVEGYKILGERGSYRLLGATDSCKMQESKLEKTANYRSLANKYTATKKEHLQGLSHPLQ